MMYLLFYFSVKYIKYYQYQNYYLDSFFILLILSLRFHKSVALIVAIPFHLKIAIKFVDGQCRDNISTL